MDQSEVQSLATTSLATPEPASAGIMGVSAVGLLLRRRSRRTGGQGSF
jgi:hypothetical protein